MSSPPQPSSAAAQSPPSQPLPKERSAAPSGMKLEMPHPVDSARKGIEHFHVFSPVNQNGSFEFDRVIKSGEVRKRTRKTKSWKTIHLVLRPNLISIYKDKEGTKLRHKLNLSELTAVARQRDPKRKAEHVFGLFSPSRNFHIEANTEKEAQEWVELIRREARIDDEEEEMILTSPNGARKPYQGFERQGTMDLGGTSSSDPEPQQGDPRKVATRSVRSTSHPSQTLANYSGNDQGSYSDFSDTGFFPDSSLSLSHPENRGVPEINAIYSPSGKAVTAKRNASQMSVPGSSPVEDRVIRHGWLYLLKTKGGVRQWKSVWAVLRPKTFALYKNEEEYAASLIIPFSHVINAVDIDPPSKSKRFCLQIITEERNYRFCAMDEDALAKWLGALKSLLAKRKGAELQRVTTAKAPFIAPPQQSTR